MLIRHLNPVLNFTFLLLVACGGGADGADGADGRDGIDAGAGGSDAHEHCPGGILEGLYTVENSIDLALLSECHTVTGDLRITSGVARVSLPNLTTIGGGFEVTDSQFLTDLDLRGLSSVGGKFMVRYTGLLTLDVSSLSDVGGDLTIGGNQMLSSLEMPAFNSLGGRFAVHDNPKVASCEVQLILDRLVASGFLGETELAGNNEAAVCP